LIKIKVLHIITRLDKGGSAQNTLDTVNQLDKNKYSVTLISGYTYDPNGEIARFISDNSIDYVLIPDLVREVSPVKDIKAFFKILFFMLKNKFDIVHTHTSKAGILGRWAAKFSGVRIIIHTPHGHVFYGYFGWFKTRIFIYLESLTALITDKIITLTERGKQEHVSYGIARPGKFIPIYSGIKIKEFASVDIDRKKQKENLGIPSDAPVIGTVTRLDPIKGNHYFISALPEVVKIFPQIRVLIIGDGSERSSLEQAAKDFGISRNVMFLGMQTHVRNLVAIFDIFVLSSLNEGMGRCLLEAQLIGVPVVATKVGGIPEVVRNGMTGILVPEKNSLEISRALIKILSDASLRNDMSQEARHWVSEKFSVEAMVEKISGLYEKMLEVKCVLK